MYLVIDKHNIIRCDRKNLSFYLIERKYPIVRKGGYTDKENPENNMLKSYGFSIAIFDYNKHIFYYNNMYEKKLKHLLNHFKNNETRTVSLSQTEYYEYEYNII